MKNAKNHKGVVIRIEKAKRGKACDCYCLECGTPVIARKGDINEWHFAHTSSKDCNYSLRPLETDLHLLAKSIISENLKILTPSVFFENKEIYKAKPIFFDRIDVEKRVDIFTPDLIGYIGNKFIWIEVAVTHFTEPSKIQFCRDNNICLIELDISKTDRNISKDNLIKVLFQNYIHWSFLFSKKIINRAKTVELNLNNYDTLITYKALTTNGCDPFRRILGVDIPLLHEFSFYQSRIDVIERNALDISKKTENNDIYYIKNKIKDYRHICNWWNKRIKRMNHYGAMIPVSSKLKQVVEDIKLKFKNEFYQDTENQYMPYNKVVYRSCEGCNEMEEESRLHEGYCMSCIEEIEYSRCEPCNSCGIMTKCYDLSGDYGLCISCKESNNAISTWDRDNKQYT